MRTTARPRSRTVLDELQHLGGLDDAERRRRLVHDDHVLGPHRGPGDGHRLALAAGERGHRAPAGPAPGPTPSSSKRAAVRWRISRWSCRTAEAAQLAAQEHVRRGVQVGRQREVLVDGLDAQRRGVARACRSCTTLAVHEDLARVGRVDPGEHLDERGLAGAVVADERGDLAREGLERGAAQRAHLPKDLTMSRASSAGPTRRLVVSGHAVLTTRQKRAADCSAAITPPLQLRSSQALAVGLVEELGDLGVVDVVHRHHHRLGLDLGVVSPPVRAATACSMPSTPML